MVHQPANRKMTLSRVPVGMKIMSGVLVAGVGILVIMAVAMLDLSHMKAAQTALQQRALAPLTAMSEVRRAYLQTRIDALTDLWIDSQNGAAYEAYASDKKQMTAALKELDRVTATPHQRDQAAKLASAWTTYLEGVDDPAFKAAARSRDLATYAKIRDDHVAPAATEIKETAEAMRKDIAGQAQTQEMASRTTYDQSVRLMLVVGGLALLAASGLGIVATAAVTRPLRRLGTVCAAVADGDLTQAVDLAGTDEVCRVAQALDLATGSTHETVSLLAGRSASIAQTADTMAEVTSHISDAAQVTSERAVMATLAAGDVAQGVQSVAAGAEQMSASIQEIAATPPRRRRSAPTPAAWPTARRPPWPSSATPRAGSVALSRSSRRSPSRPTCSR